MNIIIEDVASLKFFVGEGKWSSNAAEGKHYLETAQAFRAARQEPIGKFNIAGHIAGTNQLVNLRHGHGAGVQ